MGSSRLGVGGGLAMDESVRKLNESCRRVLMGFHRLHLSAAGKSYEIEYKSDIDEMGGNYESFRQGAERLVERRLARHVGYASYCLLPEGVRAAEDPALLDKYLPLTDADDPSKLTGISEGLGVSTKDKALAHIDRVLAHRPASGGTEAATEIATSFRACVLRWAPVGSVIGKWLTISIRFRLERGAQRLSNSTLVPFWPRFGVTWRRVKSNSPIRSPPV
jgi:hypothetical protein